MFCCIGVICICKTGKKHTKEYILLSVIIGAVTDEEEIVISSNNGEPVAGKDSPLGQIFVDICRRIMGEDIPVAQPSVWKGLMKRLKSILEKKGK